GPSGISSWRSLPQGLNFCKVWAIRSDTGPARRQLAILGASLPKAVSGSQKSIAMATGAGDLPVAFANE
ncbi:MAG TPA: hypothetical protein PKA88_09695, partial [Polyangiaceae bacterium]|nr:hypothetical protein [Polyangiaceae bacterium]